VRTVVVALLALVGPHRTKELLLTGRRVGSAEAVRLGLAARCVPAAELDGAARSAAATFAAGTAYAARATKLAVNHHLRATVLAALDVAFAYEHISRGLPAHREAVAEFTAARRQRAGAGAAAAALPPGQN
jgi:enoyl-CoA hydratase/carnithine racemase